MMDTWIALLRGINVGGHNRLPMKDLIWIFESAGCVSVKTYIQSGNVAFRARLTAEDRLADIIRNAIDIEFDFRPEIHLLSAKELIGAIAANPYPHAVGEPKTLHLYFLTASPQSRHVWAARELLAASETFDVIDRFLYLHAPDGVARSRFAKGVDKALHTSTTARNWRTVLKLAELASSLE